MKCFYHDDADGHCAGFWVYLSAGVKPLDGVSYDLKSDGGTNGFIAIQHGDHFPLEDIIKDEQVYIVDYSVTPEIMEKLLEITEDVIWIDHHASAIEKYKDFPKHIKGLRYDGIAGCELTYAYLHQMNTDRGDNEDNMIPFEESMLDDCPMFTRLLGDRDVWKFAYGEDSNYFHEAYLLAGSPHPWEYDWWFYVMHEESTPSSIKLEVEKGLLCHKHSIAINKAAFSSWGYEAMFNEHKIIACNSTNRTSKLFGEEIDKYPFVAVYTHDGAQFTCSLYSTQMDVSHIAVGLGGGGHKRACGFTCDTLPFKKIERE